ncbi:MAG: ATPase [Ruminiclostridium sp.]|nr:ATPase [Ruminiclostridium sp.]
MDIKQAILSGKTSLGIELGSTRIKAVLVDGRNNPVAQGSHSWENELRDGIWTYSPESIDSGIKDCYASLIKDIKEKYDIIPETFGSIGISAMMHGYMAFNEKWELISPFRTWRNTITGEASKELTALFDFPVPQRWSIAHLYQCILEKQEHLKDIVHLTTLAGYIHYRLTGENLLGVGEASGMFPIDSNTLTYNSLMVEKFDARAKEKGFDKPILSLLPSVLSAGENAGTLTPEGAGYLDASGTLKSGIPMCAPEGDAGTGMTATNSIAPATGNVSAGTSVFAMVVLEKPLSKAYSEIDVVTTPTGEAVAMVHCNNCTSELNAWVNIFREFSALTGSNISDAELYNVLFNIATKGDKDCGKLLAYNYLSGEHVTGFDEGRPMLLRTPDSNFTLANLMRTELYTALGALKTGLDILLKEENVRIASITGHGGFFKTENVGQSILAAAVNTPVSVMTTAGEGGAWGMAILASYMINKDKDEKLCDYLNKKLFANAKIKTLAPDKADVEGFEEFMKRYAKGLAIERAAVENL